MDVSPATPPPPALPHHKKPFAFHAAKASLIAPLLALGLDMIMAIGMVMNTMLTKGMPDFSPNVLRITLGISIAAFGLLTITGLILGIYSLFCIPRYGKKGILGYAIAGIVLSGLPWVLIITSSVVATLEHMNSIPEK